MRRILCFGDSNTYGYSPVDGQRYGEDVHWPGVLNGMLGDKFEVINEGKNGRTVAFDDPYNEGCNGMNDIEDCLDRHAPLDLVIIMLGTNDLKVYFESTPQAIANNLLEMCKLVQSKTDAKIVLVSPALLGDQIEFSPLHLEFGRMQVDYSFELAPEIEKVAKEVGAEFVDLAIVAVSSDVDCLHLMPEEHAKVAQAMDAKVRSIFAEELEREAREEEEAARLAELKRIQEEEAEKQKAEEEARRKAEEEERRKAEEEARQKAEEEEKARAEEAARLKVEEERQRAEEEARQKAEEEERKKAEAEAELREIQEAAKRKEEAILKAAEEEAAKEVELQESAPDALAGSLFADIEPESASAAESDSMEVPTVDKILSANSEKEKMLSGKLYKCNAKLREEMMAARKLTGAYNQTLMDEQEKRVSILNSLCKRVGTDPYIEPPFRCDYGSNITLGNNFYANFDCVMLDTTDIKIGDNVFLGPNVSIYTACHPIYAPVRNEQLEYSKEVTIGDDVWIGGNVTINPGVHIGSNVVIGSGSVVTGDIPDGVVAAGNPCRIIRRISEADRKYWEEKKAEYGE